MILADKIMNLRKKAGWSQEDLANQLGVTRQSVSKWEGAQSVPDLDKVVQMSRIFGVTTDYLLKEELGEPEYAETRPEAEEMAVRRVSMEEASYYLKKRKEAAPKIAIATFLCIISPVCLIFLGALSEYSGSPLSENLAGGLGLCILLVLVAIGVVLFISCGAESKDFEYLEKEIFETEYGVKGMVKERKQNFQSTYTRLNMIGTVLCILSAIPLFVSMSVESDFLAVIGVCLILILAGIGCIAFCYGGVIWASMEKLLQEGDYTRAKKEGKHLLEPVTVVYWLAVTAIFLWYTFGPKGNGQWKSCWLIWAIGGVIYGAVAVVVKLMENSRGNKQK